MEVLKRPELVDIPDRAKSGVSNFIDLIEWFKGHLSQDPSQALKLLVERIDFRKAIYEEVKSDKMRDFKWENVEELITAISTHTGPLNDFIADTLLDNRHSPDSNDMRDLVSLMTFHSAKGLEFPYCYLIGLEDHIIPHERSQKEGGIEEERRLMYVALTRAQEKLTLSMARQRPQMGQNVTSQPSRFLLDIPKELLNVVKWDLA